MIGACFFSCASRDDGLISLLEQIPEEEPAGPWRFGLALDKAEDMARGAVGLKVTNEAFMQTRMLSRLPFALTVEEEESVLLHISYEKNWRGEGAASIRLIGADQEPSSDDLVLHGSLVQTLIEAPRGGAHSLLISHRLPTGTALPIRSIVAVVLGSEVGPRDVQKARLLLHWASRDNSYSALKAAARRKFPLSIEGCTRTCVTLTAGDTLQFRVDGSSGDYRLQFWTVELKLPESESAFLRAEERGNRGWEEIVSWTGTEADFDRWSKITTDLTIGPGTQALRLVVGGGKGIVCLGEPVLLPIDRPSHKKNLIVIDLDTMRADRLGSYGYRERPTSTRLDSILAAKGFFVFLRAYSSASWTLPATAKIFTSRYRDIHHSKTIASSYTTLSEILREQGYYCTAVTGGGPLRHSGFEQGFHDYYWTWWYGKAEETVIPATDWLKRRPFAESPLFLFLHTFESHAPYTRSSFCDGLEHGRLGDLMAGERLLPKGFHECSELTREESLYVEAAYDGGVHHACCAVANFFHAMDELGLWENTVVVILSDHGEEFWDHFPMFGDHGHSLYGEQINIPFMIYDPDLGREGLKPVETEASNVDLVPTVLDLLGIDSHLPFDGTSLRPLLQGKEIQRRIPIMATLAAEQSFESPEITRACVIVGGKKLISPWFDSDSSSAKAFNEPDDCRYYPPAEELFLLGDDPEEGHNLNADTPALLKEMEILLQEAFSMALPADTPEPIVPQATGLSPDIRRQLEALGYVEN